MPNHISLQRDNVNTMNRSRQERKGEKGESIRISQAVPCHPEGQVHVPGDVQTAPLVHP